MDAPQTQSAVNRQLDFLRGQIVLIVLVTAAAIGAAAAVSYTQPKVYKATTKIVVGQGGGVFQPQYGNVFQPYTQTMSSLLESNVVAATVVSELHLHQTPKQLLGHVNVSSTPDSAVLVVGYESHDRLAAVRILRAVAASFTSLVRQRLGASAAGVKQGALPPITATVFDPAHASATPISPRPVRTMAFAGVVGLLLGLLLGLARDALDERVHTKEDAERLLGAPVLAVLPQRFVGAATVDRLEGKVAQTLAAVEPLRRAVTGARTPQRVIVVTGDDAPEVKSSVAAGLALALALAGEDAVCVDADGPWHPLREYLGPQTGSAVLSAVDELPGAVREIPFPARNGRAERGGVATATAGRVELVVVAPSNFANGRTFPSWEVPALVRELKQRARYVVIDAPRLGSESAVAWLLASDSRIVVTSEEKLTRRRANAIRESLGEVGVGSYGVVTITARR
jgi:capsular polysaccharide biosynthesis protein/Mrp family chromosome partitioning ATPase